MLVSGRRSCEARSMLQPQRSFTYGLSSKVVWVWVPSQSFAADIVSHLLKTPPTPLVSSEQSRWILRQCVTAILKHAIYSLLGLAIKPQRLDVLESFVSAWQHRSKAKYMNGGWITISPCCDKNIVGVVLVPQTLQRIHTYIDSDAQQRGQQQQHTA